MRRYSCARQGAERRRVPVSAVLCDDGDDANQTRRTRVTHKIRWDPPSPWALRVMKRKVSLSEQSVSTTTSPEPCIVDEEQMCPCQGGSWKGSRMLS